MSNKENQGILHKDQEELQHYEKAQWNFRLRQSYPSIADDQKWHTDYQLRLDASELIDKTILKYRFASELGSQKYSFARMGQKKKKQPRRTHAKLAVARFDTLAKYQNDEADRVLEELQEQAKNNL